MTIILSIAGQPARTISDSDSDAIKAAMAALWAAKAAGTPASMTKVEDDTDGTDDTDDEPTQEIPRDALRPVVAAAVAPVSMPPSASRSAADRVVSPVAVARIADDERLAESLGFALPAPLFAAGTRVIQLGEDNFAAERVRVESLPSFSDAAAQIRAVIAREQRADVTFPAQEIRMDSAGRLITPHGPIRVTRSAFGQLATRAGFAAGTRYLAQIPAPRRGVNVTADLEAAGDLPVTLRCRRTAHGPEVYSVVSPAYAAVDAPAVLAAAGAALADTRAEITYDGSATVATSLWLPDHVADLAAGDVFKAGVRVSTDDTGNGRITVQAVLFRNLCLNLIVIGEATVTTLAQVHRGDTSVILDRIAPAVQEARGLIAPFLARWQVARSTAVQGDPRDLIARLVGGRSPIAPPTKGEIPAAERAIVEAWHEEPGLTWADVVNACTRAAHESRELVPAYRAQLERAAPLLAMELPA